MPKSKNKYLKDADDTAADALLRNEDDDDIEILDLEPPERKVTVLHLLIILTVLFVTVGTTYLWVSYYLFPKFFGIDNATLFHLYHKETEPDSFMDMIRLTIPGQSVFETMEDVNDPACHDVPENDRFDCFPELNSNEEGCYTRGCCWQEPKIRNKNVSAKPLGVPYCYYPYSYIGYQLEAQKHTGNGIIMFLKRLKPSGFPKDIQEIVLNCTFLNKDQIRIKIYDATQPRYEVLVTSLMKNIHRLAKHNIKDLKYSVGSNLTSLWITRISSGKVIFSINFAQLVYADQMIQISVRLPSNYVYGIGETKAPFLKSTNWTRYVLFARDRLPQENLNSYSTHPFYLVMEDSNAESSGNGHGVLFLNSNAMEVVLQPTPAVTFRPIGGIVDMIVHVGPSPNEVISQYTSSIGYSFLKKVWKD